MAFADLLEQVNFANYQVIRIDTKERIRMRPSGKHKQGEINFSKTIVCKCPSVGCGGTVKIKRKRDLVSSPKCRSCAVLGSKRKDKKVQIWQVLTTDINEDTTLLAKSNPNLFLREEGTLTKKNGLAKRVILKCATPNCGGTISTNLTNRTAPKHSKCRSCCQKGKPFERTYNNAKRRSERTKLNGISIRWLLSYDEFSLLCQIPNCHYCNRILDRAEFKSDQGSTALLLDRKDSNKDYTFDNCVPCCPDCNFTKNERISYDEMVLIMKHRGLWVEDKQ